MTPLSGESSKSSLWSRSSARMTQNAFCPHRACVKLAGLRDYLKLNDMYFILIDLKEKSGGANCHILLILLIKFRWLDSCCAKRG